MDRGRTLVVYSPWVATNGTRLGVRAHGTHFYLSINTDVYMDVPLLQEQ